MYDKIFEGNRKFDLVFKSIWSVMISIFLNRFNGWLSISKWKV